MTWIDIVLTYSLWGMGVIIALLMIIFIIFIRKYKHIVVIRKVVNNRTKVRTVKARSWTDTDGSRWWKILKADTSLEKKLPHPPEEAIDLTEKGLLFAEAHQMESGEYRWITDDVKAHKFETIPANHRIMLASQLRKADEENQSLWNKHAKTFIIGGFVLICLAMILIFGGELLSPLNQMGDSFRSTADTLNEAMEKHGEVQLKIAEIENKVQTLEDSEELKNIENGENK